MKSNNEVYNVLNYIKSKIISLNNRNFNYLEFKNCFNDFTSNQVKLLFDILIEKGWVLNKGIYFVLNNNFSIHFSENTSKAIHNFKDNNNYFEDYYSFLKNNERFENIIEFIDLKINNSIEKHLFLRILSDEKITMKDIKNEFDIDYYEYKKKIMFFLTKDKNIPENMFIDLFSKFHIEYDIFNYETSLPIESYNYLILYCKHVKKVNSYNKLKGSISVDLWHSKRKLLETKFNYKFENHASKLILEGARITIDDYIEKYLSKNSQSREKNIFFERLSNKTLEGISYKYNLTKERVRQILNSFFNKKMNGLNFIEKDYINLLSEYNISPDVFEKISNLGERSFYFIKFFLIKDKNKNKKSEIDYLQVADDSIKEYINKKYNLIDFGTGEYVKNSRKNLLINIVRTENSKINKNKILEILKNKHNILLDERVIETRLSNSSKILQSLNFNFRFYDIESNINNEYNNKLREMLNVPDGIYSSNYFYTNYVDLMKELDIMDFYELHNLLRKIILNDPKIYFGRMPMIFVGYKNKQSFYDDILNLLAPIKLQDFIKYLVNNYGYNKISLNANLKKEIGSNFLITSGTIEKKGVNFYFDNDVIEMINRFIDNRTFISRNEVDLFYEKNSISKNYLSNILFDKLGYKMNHYYLRKIGFSIEGEKWNILLTNKIYKNELFRYCNRNSSELFYNELNEYKVIEINKNEIIHIDYFTQMTNINLDDIINFNQIILNEISNSKYSLLSFQQIKKNIQHKIISENYLNDFAIMKLISKSNFVKTFYGKVIFFTNKLDFSLSYLLEEMLIDYMGSKNKILFIEFFEFIYDFFLLTNSEIDISEEWLINKVVDFKYVNYDSKFKIIYKSINYNKFKI